MLTRAKSVELQIKFTIFITFRRLLLPLNLDEKYNFEILTNFDITIFSREEL